jgi:transcriptional regulator with XRE-family HTH domain
MSGELQRRRRRAFGRVIRERRVRLGLTQGKLAELAARGRQTICRWENGKNSPSLDELWLLADTLEMWLSEIARATDNMADPPTQDGK